MKAELAKWNNGNGIDLKSWISCSRSYRLALGYAECFWPEFEIVGDYLVRAGTTKELFRQWETGGSGDRRKTEATMNHLHLIDINYHDHENPTEDLLMRLGTVLTEIYEAKLRWQFPERPFVVSFVIPENRQQFDEDEINFWLKSHERSSNAVEQGTEGNASSQRPLL